ncbi:hypothetical protein ANO14919_019310 [Xylariales sp. No.14919]|nr:hypothetical protein ANO14919_019310 [Xylariales sp. No.14919]
MNILEQPSLHIYLLQVKLPNPPPSVPFTKETAG